ncbi:hypothetical protein [Streptomyces violascens]|uniref:hypothetical protein n=1 Tax=Streptomyces violascens TaxID=67381 RepID=UPI001678ECF7|nr:hypothetical protein [Streptomyces violascens]GGU39242.1 hypothetical protein GCM10010289_70200 [Streptomyces violascens]
MPMSDDEIRKVLTDYDTELAKATAELRTRRAQRLQAALDSGRSQADIIRATGKSREAVRQFLDPAAADAAAAAKRNARAADRTT